MSQKHLEAGQPLPALKDGSIRLFSMKYCPFAQRARLVLKAKGIDYEVINCNLKKKPEFLFEREPEGKVPIFEHNGKVISESNIICDFLDEVYPDPPLYPKDPYDKAKDKMFMEAFSSKVIPAYFGYVMSGEKNKEAATKHLVAMTLFDAELKKRGTPFFGGQQPSMVDFNAWSFNERTMASDSLMSAVKTKLPALDAYYKRMVANPTVKAVLNSKEAHQKYNQAYVTGTFLYDF
ncbi:glutathione S-transferase omega-1-like [Patiria miniata]|uniref:Glutathione S-transferase omega n=1 Tax=Patiria miniata TaxID=46514 RepID=A0A914B0Y0_PATMI|nr:glutathione S-transferase omega-1-like [Patiria miniata]XP_038070248.1 glutathione S-transferase omega-1-like [Patiria miniata]